MLETINSTDTISPKNWYELENVGMGITAIREPHHFEDVISYLVTGSKRDLLIDTGMGIVPISNALTNARGGEKEIVVVNTHAHFDHIGGNGEFDYALITPNWWETLHLISGWTLAEMEKYGVSQGFKKTPEGFNTESYSVPPYDRFLPVLEDGYEIDLGDRVVTIIETPGHTPGGVSLIDRSSGDLFTSDLLYEGPLYAFESESNVNQYLKSLRKLRGEKILSIHPGHNYSENSDEPNLLEDAIDLFERAVRHDKPDHDGEFPNTSEYRTNAISARTGEVRRLKLIV